MGAAASTGVATAKEGAAAAGTVVRAGTAAVGTAASKAVEFSKDASFKLLKEGITAQFGSEFWDALVAINECMEKVYSEVGADSATSRFGGILALPLVFLEHEQAPMPVSKGIVDDRELFTQSRRWLEYADAAYVGSVEGVDKSDHEARVAKMIGGYGDVLKAFAPAAVVGNVQCPGHFVALDASEKVVILSIRGTASVADAVTDAVGHSVPLPEVPGVETHQGILTSAREVLRSARDAMNQALAANEGFGVVVTGHSLGAGTALVCTLLLNAETLSNKPKLRCFAYAPPPVVSSCQHKGVSDLEIYCFVNRYDVVPRLSMRNMYVLAAEANAVDSADITIAERLDLARGIKSSDGTSKEKVIAAVQQGRQATCAAKIVAHYIPGRVLWIEWPPVEVGKDNVEGTVDDKVDTKGCKVHEVDTLDFQRVLLRGGSYAALDHKTGNYRTALASADAALESAETGRKSAEASRESAQGAPESAEAARECAEADGESAQGAVEPAEAAPECAAAAGKSAQGAPESAHAVGESAEAVRI